MDHLRTNSHVRWFEYPPKIPDLEILGFFSSGLYEIINVKLGQLLERQDQLLVNRENKLAILQENEVNRETEYFWTLLVELDFVEYFVIQRWLRYWLRLLSKTDNNSKWITDETKKQGVSEEQIIQAKEAPIDELYEGRLRKIGERYSGLCPFHEEKTPSFIIFANENTYYCFGCHAWGDAVDFYMKINKCNLIQAVKALI